VLTLAWWCSCCAFGRFGEQDVSVKVAQLSDPNSGVTGVFGQLDSTRLTSSRRPSITKCVHRVVLGLLVSPLEDAHQQAVAASLQAYAVDSMVCAVVSRFVKQLSVGKSARSLTATDASGDFNGNGTAMADKGRVVVLTWTRMTGVEGQLAAVISAKLRLASFMRRKSLRPALPLHSGAATSSKDTRGEQGRRYWRAGEDGSCRHTHWFATARGHGARATHGGPVADMFGGYHVIVAGVHDDLSRCAVRHRVMC
jgi:hypothetical protein